MADLAVGLSKTVVEGALSKVQSAIDEDAKLRQKAQRDLVAISLEFEMMQSFLSVANEEISAKNNLVVTWVRHVRELAYDLEDCVEFVIHLDDKPIFWRRLLPSCMVAPLPLDLAVAEIEDIKGRAEELSKCYLRYSNITDSAGSKLVMLQQQASSRAAASTALNMLAEARDATRRWHSLVDLNQLISNGRLELQVISVWGTGGDHGITPIIRKMYNDPEICQNFACRVWVKLMHPFNPREFVRRFMAQVYANACNCKEGADVGAYVLKKIEAKQADLLQEFVKEVNTKTYLVVLENLGVMVDWDAVRTFLPDMNNGSWIIVSTQQSEIASMCIGHSFQPLELKQFSAEHSVCALFKKGSDDHRDKAENPSDRMSNHSLIDWMSNHSLIGRESEMNELRSCTARARFNSSKVIMVWGIPGIGKSALIRNLYYDRMLGTKQFNQYRWVDVSHPFNLRDFCRSLLSDFHSEKDPIKECHEILIQDHCLLVIDDLQSKEEWDLIQSVLVSRNSSSVIIVITTEASIAKYCTNKEQVFNVNGLDSDAALHVLMNEVHKKDPAFLLKEYEKDAEVKELILKCGGLPEVILSIANILATQEEKLMDTILSLNHNFINKLQTNPGYDSLWALFGWIHSYLRTCPDSLKPCIFYLSLFPRDHIIRRRRLVKRWIAEGYSRDNDDKSAEEIAEEFFSRLIDLSILQQPPQETATNASDGTRIGLCQVNGFIREYIVSQLEENLVFELDGICSLTTQRTGRHLVILKSWDRDIIVFKSIDFSRLRSLTVFGKWESFFIAKSIKTLRVLDLEDASGVTDGDLEKMVKLLHRLKFLSLRGRYEICHLPSSVGDLRQLQTLDVRGTSIRSLPRSITKIKKLQYVCAGTSGAPAPATPALSSRLPGFHKHQRCLVGVKVPRGIGKLTALHTLGIVNIAASGGKLIVEELKKLTQLRKLKVSGINRHNSKELLLAISSHVHLESLLVQLDEDNQRCLDDTGLSLPFAWGNLQSLKLYGLYEQLPLYMNHLSMLRKLDLEMDNLKINVIEFLARLPLLCILRLCAKRLQDGKLHFFAQMYGLELTTFKKVKIMEIACSSSSSHVTFGSKSMNNLELLKLDCSSASYQLTGLNYIYDLKQVLVMGTDDATIKTDIESQLVHHPREPVVKLQEQPGPCCLV